MKPAEVFTAYNSFWTRQLEMDTSQTQNKTVLASKLAAEWILRDKRLIRIPVLTLREAFQLQDTNFLSSSLKHVSLERKDPAISVNVRFNADLMMQILPAPEGSMPMNLSSAKVVVEWGVSILPNYFVLSSFLIENYCICSYGQSSCALNTPLCSRPIGRGT